MQIWCNAARSIDRRRYVTHVHVLVAIHIQFSTLTQLHWYQVI